MPLPDYSKLKARMTELELNQQDLAKLIDISETTLSLKLTGKGVFKQSEIHLISAALRIPTRDIGSYFFTPKV